MNPEHLKKLNSISPSFCLAKWLQVTVDLVNGTTHSCHHPLRHSIPAEELISNPSALHNTSFKKEQRKMMLEGIRPPECSYCWDIEDLGNLYSDRYIKSADNWAWPDLEKIAGMPWDQNVNPRYLEVMLDDACNFSCAYCMSHISSGVAAEMEKYGPYPITLPLHRDSIKRTDLDKRKPFVEAFEKWLPDVLDDLKVFRLTGGEPLISPLFWSVLERLKAKKNSEMVLAINSHLNHSSLRLEKLCSQVNDLMQTGKIRSFELYTSLDTYGSQAEYIRHGMKYELVLQNIEKMQQFLPDSKLIVMCTFNILSIAHFDKFLDDIISLKKKYKNIILDISYLKNPDYLRADMATPTLISHLQSHFIKMKTADDLFNPHEITKMETLFDWVVAPKNSQLVTRRRNDFFRFVSEYDKRKNKNFNFLFPEYREFIILCKQAAFSSLGVCP